MRFTRPRRLFVLGATGIIGRATARALVKCGHEWVCFVRPRAGVNGVMTQEDSTSLWVAKVNLSHAKESD